MRLGEYNFNKVTASKTNCVENTADGNHVVVGAKSFYLMEQIANCAEMEGFYLGVSPNDGGSKYSVWCECGGNLVRIWSFYEENELEDIIGFLGVRLQYKGADGLKQYLSEMEQVGGFIDQAKIVALMLAGEKESADHFACYRKELLAKRAEREHTERESDWRSVAEREYAAV